AQPGGLTALRLAVRRAPWQVPQLLADIGDRLLADGSQSSVVELLGNLPREVRWAPTVVVWRLLAGLDLGRELEILAELDGAPLDDALADVRAIRAEAALGLG